MPETYITRMGQTIDLVCLDYYGFTKEVTELVLSENSGVAELGSFLPLGTKLVMPDYQPKPENTLPKLWD